MIRISSGKVYSPSPNEDHVSLGQMLLSHCKITQTLALNIVKAGRFNNTWKVIFGGNFCQEM